ncbi:hypothetical protein [Endozoicomonas euniceicola]|uniref:Uncharacterized protein n=1 Tax=Endozoicomonas euniceicola TaxID=1234143 RepID=A0ABY6H0K7_9GAMM|nr:hypothetical protein [Endozoicomonas euniceicola]UYM18582.1 hypothetical protein NX720_12000 [Endozoicomonas euniceicola]
MAEQLGFTIRQRNIHLLDFILSLIAALGGDGNWLIYTVNLMSSPA